MYIGVVVVTLYINTQIHNFFVPYSMSRILESILQLLDSQRSQLFPGHHRKGINQLLLGCQRKRKPPGMVNFHLSFPSCSGRKLLFHLEFNVLLFGCFSPKHVPCRRPAKIDLSGKWSQCIFHLQYVWFHLAFGKNIGNQFHDFLRKIIYYTVNS